MSEEQQTGRPPVKVVRFGVGKEIELYPHELVVTGVGEDQETRLRLDSIERLILTPGDPHPSKLILMADLHDGTTVILVEGMTNARDFRAMVPLIREISPEIQFDPVDIEEQLRQALNTRRAWTLTCYGAFLLLCVLLFALYLLVAYIGGHH
jgi:hypothetical protein